MSNARIRNRRRQRRKRGLRKRLLGTPQRPRLTVNRSLRHTSAQLIDDLSGRTLVAASTIEGEVTGSSSNKEGAAACGKLLAQRAGEAGIAAVVFDRNGYRYHGRVRALADGARDGGLRF